MRVRSLPANGMLMVNNAAATVGLTFTQQDIDEGKVRYLGRLVRGELDWIVMKCLEKDRTRRYETANGLARDVERYLADEPVQACPPSAGYRPVSGPEGEGPEGPRFVVKGVAYDSWQAVPGDYKTATNTPGDTPATMRAGSYSACPNHMARTSNCGPAGVLTAGERRLGVRQVMGGTPFEHPPGAHGLN